ncbi:MAG: type II secretion system protein [Armatimonadetes bacterium]|nr:type II secretion system protein [Armatimonadota bacterium]
MRRTGFTIPQLLVIVAIVAILTAVLRPILLTAREAGRQGFAAERLEHIAYALFEYTYDANDTMPLASVVIDATCQQKRVGLHMDTAFLLPFNAGVTQGNGPDGCGPLAWRTLPWQEAGMSQWANAIVPYSIKDLLSIQTNGLPVLNWKQGSTEDVFPKSGWPAPLPTSLTFNGLLHKYPMASVQNPNSVPLVWSGLGPANIRGRAFSNPILNCMGQVDDCRFSPNAPPGSLRADSTQSGDRFLQHLIDVPDWDAGEKRPAIFADLSVRQIAMGIVKDGNPRDLPLVFETSMQNLAQCAENQKRAEGNEVATYSCYFRPDKG